MVLEEEPEATGEGEDALLPKAEEKEDKERK